MIDPNQDRRPPITPQLALRVAVLGGMAFVLFAIIFFRLWYLQVLSGDQYLQQARDNRVREVLVQAPRGNIVDRDGKIIVENRPATVVQIDPESLPAEERQAAAEWFDATKARAARPKGKKGPQVPIPEIATPALRARFERLGAIIDLRPAVIQERVIRALGFVSYSVVTIKVDVPESIRNVLLEHQAEFPGVSVSKRYLRGYPGDELAAQLLGYVGQVDDTELKQKRFKGVKSGTVVGKGGLEYSYDQYLRGRDGATRITVDALGRPKGQASARKPVSGRQLRTTLDLGLQQTGEKYLKQVVDGGPGIAGAFVALDPRNGEVLGMGSYPTFDPSIFSGPVTEAQSERLFGDTGNAPIFNRAIGGQYATGSIFKPITALAGLSTGLITPSTVIDDQGCTTVGDNDEKRCNAREEPLGPVDLRKAIAKSSDIYFYELGERLNGQANQPLQRWARRLSLGAKTEIDLPSEAKGIVPDRAWRARQNDKERAWEKRTGNPCCLYSDKRPWTVGDEVGLAIGQGDVAASPLQMAVAYAALANGNRVVRPHLGSAIEDANGTVLQRIEAGSAREVSFDPVALDAIRDGLHEVTTDGTAADVFDGWAQDRYPVFGKTGTVQRDGRLDQSWFAAYVNDRDRPIVVVVTVEDGGYGAEAAAPIARTLLAKWYGQPITFKEGTSATR